MNLQCADMREIPNQDSNMNSSATSPKKTKSPATTKPAPKPPKPEPAHWFAGLAETAKEKIRWVPVADLTEHPACNSLPFYPNVLALIQQSVKGNGILFPLAVAANGQVIDGRYRLRAAKLLGLKTLPVIDIDIVGDSVTHWLFHVKLDREHLSEGERLVLANEYHQLLSATLKKDRARKMTAARLGKATKKRHSSEPKRDSLKETADKFDVPKRKLNAMYQLSSKRPELYAQIKSGEIEPEAAIKRQGKNVEKARVTAALETIVRPQDVTDGQMENRIHEGEAQDILKKVADDTASLVLFSPPYYGANVPYDPPLPQMTYQQYLDQLCIVVAESFRISRSGGRMMIVVDTTHNPVPGGDDALPIAADLTTIARNCGWKYWMDFAWIKPEVSGSKTTFGSLASCSAPGFGRDHEWILLFFKDQKKLDGDTALSDLTREEHQQWWHTTWDIRPETRRDILAAHPVPFPEPLVERAIKLLTYRRGLVIDPFMGSGTTGAVAQRLGRRYIGIDRSPQYCDFARQRLASVTTVDIGQTSALQQSNSFPVADAA
jgi:DNA modification methylase